LSIDHPSLKKLALSLTPDFIKDLYRKYYKNNELASRFANILGPDMLVKGSIFFFYPIYIRLMSVDEYGVYGYLVNIISVFSLALNFGIYIAQAKQYHEIPEHKRGIYIFSINTFLFIALIITLSLLLITHADNAIISFLFEQPIDYEIYRPWIVLGIINSIYSMIVYNYFMISENIKYYQIQNILKLLIVNVVVVIFLKIDHGDNVLIRIKYNYLTETLILIPFLLIYFRNISFRFDFTYVKDALYIGLPGMFSAIIGIFYSLADRKFIEQYRSHEELGIYTLGTTLSGIIWLIYLAFHNSLLPSFFKEKDKVANYRRTIRSTKKITLLLLVFSIAMYIFTYVLIVFNIIKPEYSAILPVLPIMFITQIIQSVSVIFSNYFVYFNKNYYSIFFAIVSAILNIVLCILFIPTFGILGAIISTLLVSSILCISYFIFARRMCMQ
jgi:O-antigen/teichoic acid export membrane protein